MSAIASNATHQPMPKPTVRRAAARDATAIGRFLQGLSASSRRQRFHGSCNAQSPSLALRLCQVDGVRHQAWLAWAGQGDSAIVVGEARFVRLAEGDAGPGAAELAIAVADDWQGRGVADALMRQLLSAAAAARVHNLYGDVLNGNARMQAFMRRHGFEAELFARGEVLRMRRAPRALHATVGGLLAAALSALVGCWPPSRSWARSF